MWESIILELHLEGKSIAEIVAYINHELVTPTWVNNILHPNTKYAPIDSKSLRKIPPRSSKTLQAKIYYMMLDEFGAEGLLRIAQAFRFNESPGTRSPTNPRPLRFSSYTLAEQYGVPSDRIRNVITRYILGRKMPDFMEGSRSYYSIAPKKKRISKEKKKELMELF